MKLKISLFVMLALTFNYAESGVSKCPSYRTKTAIEIVTCEGPNCSNIFDCDDDSHKVECIKNSDCPHDRTCLDNICKDLCSESPQCDVNAQCSVRNHRKECKCNDGYEGNGFTYCDVKRQEIKVPIRKVEVKVPIAVEKVKVPVKKDTLSPGECLNQNQYLTSINGCFKLIMQADGNLVVYRNSNNQHIWHTHTHRTCSNRACMQGDGNFVVYDCHNKPTWNSGTVRNEGSRLIMQPDGNLVIYAHNSNRPVWHPNTVTHC